MVSSHNLLSTSEASQIVFWAHPWPNIGHNQSLGVQGSQEELEATGVGRVCQALHVAMILFTSHERWLMSSLQHLLAKSGMLNAVEKCLPPNQLCQQLTKSESLLTIHETRSPASPRVAHS